MTKNLKRILFVFKLRSHSFPERYQRLWKINSLLSNCSQVSRLGFNYFILSINNICPLAFKVNDVQFLVFSVVKEEQFVK